MKARTAVAEKAEAVSYAESSPHGRARRRRGFVSAERSSCPRASLTRRTGGMDGGPTDGNLPRGVPLSRKALPAQVAASDSVDVAADTPSEEGRWSAAAKEARLII